jgi:hypothetical protein
MPHDQDNQEQDLSQSPNDQETSGQESTDFSEQNLDEHVEQERQEIEEINEANEGDDEEPTEGDEDSEEGGDESGDDGDYSPNTKYKVLDEEHDFDPKLKKLLTKETEPVIRELYEKAHGIEGIKASRTQAVRERDEVQGNYNNLVQEVARVINYRKAGDLDSFFESVQLDDNAIAGYILEKIRISKLSPEERAVYDNARTLRKRLTGVEAQLHSVQSTGSNREVQDRLTSLDQVLGGEKMKSAVSGYDARNGKGSFRSAVINWAASQQNDLQANEAVEGFMKTFGLNAVVPQKATGGNPTKRVVKRPQVKTIPNYGGGQASVTATKKPKSVEDLRKLARGESI